MDVFQFMMINVNQLNISKTTLEKLNLVQGHIYIECLHQSRILTYSNEKYFAWLFKFIYFHDQMELFLNHQKI